MLFLVWDIFHDKRQILPAKADYTKSALPAQRLEPLLFVNLPRRGPLQVSDQMADPDERLHAQGQVHMSLRPTDRMEKHPLRLSAPAAQESVRRLLHVPFQERLVVECVPGDMETDIMKNMFRRG